jgi:hypothetical protein
LTGVQGPSLVSQIRKIIDCAVAAANTGSVGSFSLAICLCYAIPRVSMLRSAVEFLKVLFIITSIALSVWAFERDLVTLDSLLPPSQSQPAGTFSP